jgi:hypothetical protein
MVRSEVHSVIEANTLFDLEIGPERRKAAWRALLLGGLEQSDVQEIYNGLSQVPSSYDEVILRDVGRTLPQEELFRSEKGQSALFRVLHAVAVHHEDIGYVQSLNFIVATLIQVFPDDEALVFSSTQSLLVSQWRVDLYRPGVPKLGVALWQFDRLVEGFLPRAHAALVQHGITAEFYAMQWFLTLFASDLPQKVVTRVWDRFLVVGWQVIAQIGLALIAEVEEDLCKLEECAAMTLLKKFVAQRRFEAEPLLFAASKFNVSHRMLSELEAAHSRGEEPEDTQVVMEEYIADGPSRWSVQRGCSKLQRSGSGDSVGGPPKLQRSGSGDSVGSSSSRSSRPSLPRAFSRESSPEGRARSSSRSARRIGSYSEAACNVRKRTSGTVLPFLIHNLDTGEKNIMEEEWIEYMRQQLLFARPAPEASKTLLGQLAWFTSPPASPTKMSQATSELKLKTSGACGGSFWVHSQQIQAMRLMGKA